MSKDLVSCVNKAVKEGKLSKSAGEDIKDFYQKELNENVSPKEATKKALAEAEYKKKRDAFTKGLNAKAIKNLTELVDSHPKGGYHALFSTMTKDVTGKSIGSNVEYRSKAIRGMIEAKFADAIHAMRTTMAGRRQDTELIHNTVREIFKKGSTEDTQASEFAKLWGDIAEELRQLFNGAGGAIRKLDDWGLPQSHNAFNLHKKGLDAWSDNIMNKLDWERMGVAEIDRAEYLKHTFETISSGGLNKLEVGKMPKGISSAKANAHREHRELFFKDADSWIEYQKEFGNPDPFSAMKDHIMLMSNDVALMEIYGANPKRSFEYMIDYVRKKDGLTDAKERKLSGIFRVVSGEVDNLIVKDAKDYRIAQFGGVVRSIQTASKLGSAVLSSVTDLSTMIQTSRYNGMPVMKAVKSGFATMANSKRHVQATRLGVIADYASASMTSRFGEVAHGKAQTMAELVLRASGMGVWTDGFKTSFRMELMGNIGDNLSKPFSSLNKNMKKRLTENGITSKDWDYMAKSELIDGGLIDIENIAQLHKKTDLSIIEARDLAIRVSEYIHKEGDMAVITPDAHTRYYTTAGKVKGEFWGEMARMTTQFKSFPIAMVFSHMMRNMSQDTWTSKLGMTASFTLLTTIFGGMAITAKDIAKGKDPHKANLEFIGASVLQGGGWGIFGDFLFSDQTRFGNSLTATALGAIGSMGEDIMTLTVEQVQKALMSDKESNLVEELVRIGKNYLPAQNLWYTRLAFERLLYDHIKEATAKNYKSKIRKHVRKMKKETGQEYWWEIGELEPERSPRFENLTGGN